MEAIANMILGYWSAYQSSGARCFDQLSRSFTQRRLGNAQFFCNKDSADTLFTMSPSNCGQK